MRLSGVAHLLVGCRMDATLAENATLLPPSDPALDLKNLAAVGLCHRIQ